MGLISFGYQHHTLDSLLAALTGTDVDLVVDVRLTPISRKPGMSKTRLAAALAGVGIAYRHLPALGNPKPNRPAFSGGDPAVRAAGRAQYGQQLQTPAARTALAEVDLAAGEQLVALLCVEADVELCHRAVLLDLLPHHRGGRR
jgi:uncharacterized protein (DUF488 family)